MTFFPKNSQYFALNAAVLLLGFAAFAVFLYGPFATQHSAVSGEKPIELGAGTFKVAQPLLISAAPLIRVESGALNFELGNRAGKLSFISGILPAGWAQLFNKEKLETASLVNGRITLDLRTSPGQAEIGAAGNAVNQQLGQSYLSTVSLNDCVVNILRDDAAPLMLHVRAGRFDVDLGDGDFSGNGKVSIDGRQTNFNFSSAYNGENDAGGSTFALDVNLDNDHFNGQFEGVFSNREGLRLSGATRVEFKDEAALGLLFDLPAENDVKAGKNAAADAAAAGYGAYFSALGQLEWHGNHGTLADGQFKFGESPATGSLKLKLADNSRDISGTLAFARLDLTKLIEDEADTAAVNAAGDDAGAATPGKADAAGAPAARDTRLQRLLRTLAPLIREYNADLRISADEIIAGQLRLEEAGFSLFQKKGEAIFDLAETMVFDGTASGHLKIDTNYPKPRWHINMGLRDAALGKFTALVHQGETLSGKGNLKVHLTSFGDKANEIYQNMYGALLISMPYGGKVGVKLDNLLLAQENRSETELSDLTGGSSNFETLQGTGHFARGAVVMDHFSVKTASNQFTGSGRLNLFDRLIDWHVASWPLVALADDPAGGEPVKETSASERKAQPPLLLVCSEISGSWAAPRFKKYTAMHLALLRRGCPASFRAPPIKSNTRQIAPAGNAG